MLRAGMAIDPDLPSPVFGFSFENRTQPQGNLDGSLITECNTTDQAAPSQILVGIEAGALRRFGNKPLALMAFEQAPADFGFGPSVRVPESAISKNASASSFFQRPGTIPPQTPMADHRGQPAPAIDRAAHATNKFSSGGVRPEVAEIGEISLPQTAQQQPLGL